jgi:hypothetical protein
MKIDRVNQLYNSTFYNADPAGQGFAYGNGAVAEAGKAKFKYNFIVLDGSIVRAIVSIDDTDSPYSAGYVEYILCDTTAGDVTVNLPTVVGNEGRLYKIKNTGVGINKVIVDGNGAQLIDDVETFDLNALEALEIVSDGSQWWAI